MEDETDQDAQQQRLMLLKLGPANIVSGDAGQQRDRIVSIMSFFESLLVLSLVAILLLQVSRRLSLPYPSLLAMAGAAAALVPGTPYVSLEPETALALFIAPALMDAAFDFPVGTARRFWLPLLVFAIG